MFLLPDWGEIPAEFCHLCSMPSCQSRVSLTSGKTQGHSTPLFPRRPGHRLFCCEHAWSHTWSRRTEKTQRMITLPEHTAPGVWLLLNIFSVQLVFLQEKVEFSFSEAAGFCATHTYSIWPIKIRTVWCQEFINLQLHHAVAFEIASARPSRQAGERFSPGLRQKWRRVS